MLKSLLRATALLAVALIPPAAASAADDDAKLVESLPPEVADVVTGGSWSEGKQGGFYRAIVVMSGTEQSFGARVFLQWLALSETDRRHGAAQGGQRSEARQCFDRDRRRREQGQ
jgi:hypothetical protein